MKNKYLHMGDLTKIALCITLLSISSYLERVHIKRESKIKAKVTIEK